MTTLKEPSWRRSNREALLCSALALSPSRAAPERSPPAETHRILAHRLSTPPGIAWGEERGAGRQRPSPACPPPTGLEWGWGAGFGARQPALPTQPCRPDRRARLLLAHHHVPPKPPRERAWDRRAVALAQQTSATPEQSTGTSTALSQRTTDRTRATSTDQPQVMNTPSPSSSWDQHLHPSRDLFPVPPAPLCPETLPDGDARHLHPIRPTRGGSSSGSPPREVVFHLLRGPESFRSMSSGWAGLLIFWSPKLGVTPTFVFIFALDVFSSPIID